MHGFICILLVLLILLVKITYQKLFFVQVHEQGVTQQTFFTFVVQCQNFSMLMLNGTAFTIDILVESTLISSILNAFTIIDGFELNTPQINKNECICSSKSETTIVNGRKVSKYKTKYNYNNVDAIYHNLDAIDPIRVGIEENNGKQFDCDPLSLPTRNRCKITLKQCLRIEGIMSIVIMIMIVEDTQKNSYFNKTSL